MHHRINESQTYRMLEASYLNKIIGKSNNFKLFRLLIHKIHEQSCILVASMI